MPTLKIFACKQSQTLAKDIAKSFGVPLGNIITSTYSDGEFQPSFEESVRGCRVFLIGSTNPSTDNLMEMLLMLDAAKKSLDDKIGKAIRQGERQEARALTEIKNELVSKLDNLNPDYKKARKVFSDFASIESAQKQGLQFSKMRPQELKRFLKNLDPSEKEAFRIGARENLQKIVSSTSEGADPAKRIFGNSQQTCYSFFYPKYG